MKRSILTLCVSAALAMAGGAVAEGHHGGGGGGEHHGGWAGGEHHGGGGGDGWSGEHRGGNGWNGERGEHGRWDGDQGRRWGGGDRGRWDDRRFNGYWFNNRWFYGPPPQAYFEAPGFRPGYSQWRRGGFLPPYYRSWTVDDFSRYRLRRPPYGYHWIRVGEDYLLVSDRTGLIFDVIPGGD
jgi:Ni/Co efflux regulator RcnB